MAPIHTIHGLANPRPQDRTIKDRYCPGMRSCFYLNPASFNPTNRDRADTIRRVCMLVALLCSVGREVLSLLVRIPNASVLGFLIGTLAAMIGFFFMASCLAMIGNAEGERLVMGRIVTRWHFDVFLLFCACVELAAFLAFLIGMNGVSSFVLELAGYTVLPMWVMLFGVAWVATWDTQPVSMA